jgi:outer membrane protein assembly factor BamB
MFAVSVALLTVCAVAFALRRTRRRGALVLAACAFSGFALWSGRPQTPPESPAVVTVNWMFQAPEHGGVVSAPALDEERVYLAAVHFRGFSRSGAVYGIDRRTGRQLWKFDDDGRMLPTASSPALAGGKLYLGEGMHANFVCRFYCLDAATGRKAWDFETDGHVESSPCVADGRVYFGAGDDGVYCLDAATGAPRWHFREDLHIDASPAVAGGRVYVGSGQSRRFRDRQVLCLDAATGRVLWRVAVELPAWGSPALDGDRVFVGLGNGRLTESVAPPERPAGAVVCLGVDDGRRFWQAPAGDGVLLRPAVGGGRVFFGSRDGRCYCVGRDDGRPVWSCDLGSPVLAAPALADGRLYAVASGGLLTARDPETGGELWRFDLARESQTQPRVFALPRVAVGGAGQREILLGAELQYGVTGAAVLYSLQERAGSH